MATDNAKAKIQDTEGIPRDFEAELLAARIAARQAMIDNGTPPSVCIEALPPASAWAAETPLLALYRQDH